MLELLDTVSLPLYATIVCIIAAIATGFALGRVTSSQSKAQKKYKVLDDMGPQYEGDETPKMAPSGTSGGHSHASHDEEPHIPLKYKELPVEQMQKRARDFYNHVKQRRSVRFFSDRAVPIDIIENVIRAAGTSPSGANTQPWTFAVVKTMDLKQKIKDIVEEEEKINYEKRMSRKWIEDLQFIGTNFQKPYLTIAPYIIIVFKQTYKLSEEGKREPHYYFETSSGISCGILITAIHNAGLVTLTSTPMNAGPKLRELLGRPKNEKVLLLLPVGYPADDATVPNVCKKSLDEIMKVF